MNKPIRIILLVIIMIQALGCSNSGGEQTTTYEIEPTSTSVSIEISATPSQPDPLYTSDVSTPWIIPSISPTPSPTKLPTRVFTPTATYDLPTHLLTPVTGDSQDCIVVPSPTFISGTPVNGVREAGTFFLCRQYPLEMPLVEFDLDSGGMRDWKDESNDLGFGVHYNQIDDEFEYWLDTRNGARLKLMGTILPNEAACRNAFLGETENIIFVDGDETACWMTNDGWIAVIRVEQINPYGWGSIEISYTLWER